MQHSNIGAGIQEDKTVTESEPPIRNASLRKALNHDVLFENFPNDNINTEQVGSSCSMEEPHLSLEYLPQDYVLKSFRPDQIFQNVFNNTNNFELLDIQQTQSISSFVPYSDLENNSKPDSSEYEPLSSKNSSEESSESNEKNWKNENLKKNSKY